MNQIQLRTEVFEVEVFYEGSAPLVVICVDGEPIVDYVGKYHPAVLERGNSRSRYGRWIGIPPHLVHPPAKDFLGEPREEIREDGGGRVPLTVCSECGHEACDGIWARIEMNDQTVRWTDFYTNPFLNPIPLEGVPDLIFDRRQYTEAFASLEAE